MPGKQEPLSEIALLDELEDMLYISDPETYDLLYMNAYTKKLCRLPDEASYQGQKCYQVLYGENTPCEFCPIARLSHQDFYTWDSFHSRMKRFYSHRDKLIVWNNRDAHLSYSIDMTEQKKIENELLISEQRFNIAMDNSDRSLFDIDLMTHTQYNRRLNYPLTEYPKLIKNAPESIIDMNVIHPDSTDAFRSLYQQIYSGESETEADIQLIDAKGSAVWCRFILTTIFRKDGTPLRAIGVCEDISNQKKLSLKYQKSKEYQAFLLRDSVIFLDLNLTDNRVIRCEYQSGSSVKINKTLPCSQVLKELADKYIYSADAERFLSMFSRTALMTSFEEGIPSVCLEHRFVSGGACIWVSTSAHFIQDSESGNTACIIITKNIDEQKKHELNLLYQMEHDEQTGFYQLTAASKLINSRMKAQENTSEQYNALLIIQIESLTGLFSKYGNTISTHYISSFCERLKSLWRSDDIIARGGDNRFVVYVQHLSSLNAVIDITKNAMDALRSFFYGEEQIHVNIGCACFPYDGTCFEDIYSNAETALINAVEQGAWQFCYYQNAETAEHPGDTGRLTRKDIENYEKSHPPIPSDTMQRYESELFTLGNKVFHEVNSFSMSSLIITIAASVMLFITLLFGLYTDMLFPNNNVMIRILWAIFHAAILLLLWFRIIYFYQKTLYTDGLTGRDNKLYFEKNAPSLYSRKGMRFAIVYTDISKFKLINDKYGRQNGDDILIAIHEIYSKAMLRGEIAARIMADNFAMLLHFQSYDEIESRLETIDEKVRALTDFNGEPYNIYTGYGVYVVHNPELPVETMLDCANIAISNISRASRIPIGYYDDRITRHMQYERSIESRMRSALSRHEFEIYLLPKYRTSDLQIVGAEALIRWRDSKGLLCPDDFLPIFEKNGFIVQTDLFVFEAVCRTIRKWIDDGAAPYPLSVNLSAANLDIPNFLDVYQELLQRYRIPEHMIEFEITESVLYDHRSSFIQLAAQIHDMKCNCAVDDFGSSYSSLNVLKTLPIDVLKLDKSLLSVQPDSNPAGNIQIIKSIVDLAKSMNITTVFEGVETEEQLLGIQSAGCDQLHGFLCREALPVDEFEKLAYGRVIY